MALPTPEAGASIGSSVTNLARWPCRAFQGRSHLLAGLADRLVSQPVLALTGPGGVGKTQIALAYASQSTYQLVWWLRADTPEVFDAGFAALGRQVRAEDPINPAQADDVAAARAWLGSHDNWLLVVDDAREPALVLPMLAEGDGHVLITSRTPFPQSSAHDFPVPVMGASAATEFLLRRTGATDSASAGRVAAALGFLPLAMELAGAYVEQYGTFAGYLKLLAGHDRGLVAPGGLFNHERAVMAACRISLAQVRLLSQAATELMSLCAFLAPDEIPIDLLARTMATKPTAPRKVLTSNRLDEAVGVLWRLSLLEHQNYGDWVHQQVQLAARANLPPIEQRMWATAAVDALGTTFQPAPAGVEVRPESERLLPHVFAAADLAQSLGVEPAATAALYLQVGRYHRSRAEPMRARVSLEWALARSEAAYGPHHPALAGPLNDLGGVLADLGQPTAARACLERALAISDAANGPDHPEVAAIVNDLAQVLHDLGDLSAARAGFERALAIDLAAYGPDHPVVGQVVSNMAGLLRDQDDLAGARAWYERAVAIDQAAFGPDHPVVAGGLISLAGVRRDQGDLAGARTDVERALAIYQANYGPTHPVVADVIKKLAGMLRDLGDLAGARAGFERALAIEERAYGLAQPALAGVVNNLAVVLRDQGDLVGAKAGFERALAIEEAALGPNHPEVALVADNLALALQDLGDLDGAQAGFERAMAIDEACYGRGHADASLVASHLAALLAGRARAEPAVLDPETATIAQPEPALEPEPEPVLESEPAIEPAPAEAPTPAVASAPGLDEPAGETVLTADRDDRDDGDAPSTEELSVIERVVEVARALERLAEAPPNIRVSEVRSVPMVIDAPSIELSRPKAPAQPPAVAAGASVDQSGPGLAAAARSSHRHSGYRSRRRHRGRAW